MKRLGIDLGVIDAPPKISTVPDCPGGLLRLTRHDFDGWTERGERFITPRKDIPHDGYGSARIACRNPVAKVPNPASCLETFYGLCHSCSAAEATNRQDLRDRQKAREGSR